MAANFIPDPARPKKQRRALRACDFCSQRSVRCTPSITDATRCENCEDYDQPCTFDRPVKKRGAKPKAEREQQQHQSRQSQQRENLFPAITSFAGPSAISRPTSAAEAVSPLSTWSSAQPILHRAFSTTDIHQTPLPPPHFHPRANSAPQPSWQPTHVANQLIITELCKVYFETDYPTFPFFHRSTLLQRVQRGEYWTDRSFYAAVMALCALASARARARVLHPSQWNIAALTETPSETYFDAAQDAIAHHSLLTDDCEFDYMRACTLLSIVCIQYDNHKLLSYWLGIAHSLSAASAFHHERNHLPEGLDTVEVEERRRLFWSVYNIDVSVSVIWGNIMRSRETSSTVVYPTEIDDDDFTKDGFPQDYSGGGYRTWLQGWNFVTDLHRVLEHSSYHSQRLRKPDYRMPYLKSIFTAVPASPPFVLQNVMAGYEALPPLLKKPRPITGNRHEDLFGYQAANIAVAMQSVRLVLFTTEPHTVTQKCAVAQEVMSGFAAIPNAYLRTACVPALRHLGWVGTILGSAFDEGLPHPVYQMVRSVLLSLANLLANLEVDMCCPAGTADKLRTQISRIDEYIFSLRREPLTRQGFINPTASYEDQIRSFQYTLGSSASNPGSYLHRQSNFPDMADNSIIYHFPAELFLDWKWELT